WESIASRIGKITGGQPDSLKSDLVNSFRGMLLKNLRGSRCKDNEIKEDGPLPDYIEASNKVLIDRPLTHDDVRASEYVGTAKLTHLLKKISSAVKLREE